jgi:hypothetical protein
MSNLIADVHQLEKMDDILSAALPSSLALNPAILKPLSEGNSTSKYQILNTIQTTEEEGTGISTDLEILNIFRDNPDGTFPLECSHLKVENHHLFMRYKDGKLASAHACFPNMYFQYCITAIPSAKSVTVMAPDVVLLESIANPSLSYYSPPSSSATRVFLKWVIEEVVNKDVALTFTLPLTGKADAYLSCFRTRFALYSCGTLTFTQALTDLLSARAYTLGKISKEDLVQVWSYAASSDE